MCLGRDQDLRDWVVLEDFAQEPGDQRGFPGTGRALQGVDGPDPQDVLDRAALGFVDGLWSEPDGQVGLAGVDVHLAGRGQAAQQIAVAIEGVDGLLAASDELELTGHTRAAQVSAVGWRRTVGVESRAPECHGSLGVVHGVDAPLVVFTARGQCQGVPVLAGQDDAAAVRLSSFKLALQETGEVVVVQEREDLPALRAWPLPNGDSLDAEVVGGVRPGDQLDGENRRVEHKQLDLVSGADELVELGEVARHVGAAINAGQHRLPCRGRQGQATVVVRGPCRPDRESASRQSHAGRSSLTVRELGWA
jgi:hypothetical protein